MGVKEGARRSSRPGESETVALPAVGAAAGSMPLAIGTVEQEQNGVRAPKRVASGTPRRLERAPRSR